MERFTQEKIVPDIINGQPKSKLEVKWDGKDLEPGTIWTPTQVQKQPEVSWKAEKGKFYTLIFTDPDAGNKECLHWLVINISNSDIENGNQYAEYIGSGAPKDTGLHRYCFLLFKQPGKINVGMEKADKHTATPRMKFEVQKFADKYGLGTPEAGNFFLAEYDDYCPVLHAQFKR